VHCQATKKASTQGLPVFHGATGTVTYEPSTDDMSYS